jgi:polysaccharide export outer membrane protein
MQKALAMAGGFTQKSDRTGIKVTRQTEHGLESTTVEPDAVVLPDDLIVVPEVQKFYVNGEVRSPGDYSYERGLTIHKAITMAGGFTDKAAKRSTKVMRVVNGKELTLEVSLDALVLPDDIIVVPQRFF